MILIARITVPARLMKIFERSHMCRTTTLARGRIEDNEPSIALRLKLMKVEPGWQKVAREMIVNKKGNNQGTVTRLIRERERKEMLIYNEASYASQSEIRIAQELEQRGILFFVICSVTT